MIGMDWIRKTAYRFKAWLEAWVETLLILRNRETIKDLRKTIRDYQLGRESLYIPIGAETGEEVEVKCPHCGSPRQHLLFYKGDLLGVFCLKCDRGTPLEEILWTLTMEKMKEIVMKSEA